MYHVVGCTSCQHLWIRQAGGERVECPGCGRSHRVSKLRRLAATDDIIEAREARTAMLAAREDVEVAGFAELEASSQEAIIEEAEYLEAFGIDPEAVAEAASSPGTRSGDRQSLLREAIREADPATESEIVAIATEAGLSEATVREALQRLQTAGEVVRSAGEYRLL